ncbi:hypothetical protein GGTG_10610 [Gaeumannomyces tritici R3-111a-1]|uniref:Uncharacterized protein n=1 Tax=Gaeumannomyces tritici (strain R3-111a-1) TaxID=644352 RepID=J3PAT5_GAET3|nr:hypothetical protein GGTG_10610 [Gaeumannomyces tritici R3-111a-1]EJT71351.1 hypothetical protein GGTG_10610 [Gaeumannomyces tritici R3-111a-1]
MACQPALSRFRQPPIDDGPFRSGRWWDGRRNGFLAPWIFGFGRPADGGKGQDVRANLTPLLPPHGRCRRWRAGTVARRRGVCLRGRTLDKTAQAWFLGRFHSTRSDGQDVFVSIGGARWRFVNA